MKSISAAKGMVGEGWNRHAPSLGVHAVIGCMRRPQRKTLLPEGKMRGAIIPRKFNVAVSALMILAGLRAFGQTPVVPLLTEDEAVTIARAENRSAKSSAIGIDRAVQSVKEARTAFLPQSSLQVTSGYPLESFNLNIPKGALGTYSGTGPIPNGDKQISGSANITGIIVGSVSQPLTQLYAAHLGVESARVDQKVAAEQLRAQFQTVVVQVRQTYHQLCVLNAQQKTDETQIDALKAALKVAENSESQGNALQADVLSAKSSLIQAEYTQASDADAYTNTREKLNELLGRDIDTDFTVDALAGPADEPMSLADARKMALGQRSDVRQAILQEQKANLAIRQERAAYIPQINAQVSYISLQNISFLPSSLATAGFSVKWNNPWDWGSRHANIVGLRDAAKQQTLTTEDTRENAVLDVDQKYRALVLSRRMVEAAVTAKQASAEQLRNITNQFREHQALLSDVLKQAAQDRLQSQSYTQAVSAYWDARAAFDQAIGKD